MKDPFITIDMFGGAITLNKSDWEKIKDDLPTESRSRKRIVAVLAEYQP